MKKQLPGFIAGLLCAVVLFGVVGGAGALITGPSDIKVYPINIMVNGQVFQPKNVNGELVDVFKYGGTTYVPLRAIAETFGLEVGYDAEKNLATVGQKKGVQNGAPSHVGLGDTLPEAVNQNGENVKYDKVESVVIINGAEQKMDVVRYGGLRFYDVNLILRTCGLDEVSNQHIIDLISETNYENDGEYLIIDNAIYVKARAIANKFDVNASYDSDTAAVTFEKRS